MTAATDLHLSPQKIRRLAAATQITEKTIRRFFRGLPVKPTTRDRINDSMHELGIASRPPRS